MSQSVKQFLMEDESIINVIKLHSKLPKTSLQFKQMIDENIGRDIEPNKFIQISTYIAIKICQQMKKTDDKNHKEYIDKRAKLIEKGKKWDDDSKHELQLKYIKIKIIKYIY